MTLKILLTSEEVVRRYVDLVALERDKELSENAKALLIKVPEIIPAPAGLKWWEVLLFRQPEHHIKNRRHARSLLERTATLDLQNTLFSRAKRHKRRADYFTILAKKTMERPGVVFEFTVHELHDLELLPKP